MLVAWQLLIVFSILIAAGCFGFTGLFIATLAWIMWTSAVIFMPWVAGVQAISIGIGFLLGLPLAIVHKFFNGVARYISETKGHWRPEFQAYAMMVAAGLIIVAFRTFLLDTLQSFWVTPYIPLFDLEEINMVVVDFMKNSDLPMIESIILLILRICVEFFNYNRIFVFEILISFILIYFLVGRLLSSSVYCDGWYSRFGIVFALTANIDYLTRVTTLSTNEYIYLSEFFIFGFFTWLYMGGHHSTSFHAHHHQPAPID